MRPGDAQLAKGNFCRTQILGPCPFYMEITSGDGCKPDKGTNLHVIGPYCKIATGKFFYTGDSQYI